MAQSQQRWAERLSQLRNRSRPPLPSLRKTPALIPASSSFRPGLFRLDSPPVFPRSAHEEGRSRRARVRPRNSRARTTGPVSLPGFHLRGDGRRPARKSDRLTQDCLVGLRILAENFPAMPTLSQELLRALSQRSHLWIKLALKSPRPPKRGAK